MDIVVLTCNRKGIASSVIPLIAVSAKINRVSVVFIKEPNKKNFKFYLVTSPQGKEAKF